MYIQKKITHTHRAPEGGVSLSPLSPLGPRRAVRRSFAGSISIVMTTLC